MIRLRCPVCDKSLKISVDLAGKTVTCPRCDEQVVAPTVADQRPALDPVGTPGCFSTMNPRMRLIVGLAGLAGVLALGTAVVLTLLAGTTWVTHAAFLVAGCSLLLLLASLHGHFTGCPCCGKWWSRTMLKSEAANRELFQRDGATFGRSVIRTEFKCEECGHRWSVAEADEYRVPHQSGTNRGRK